MVKESNRNEETDEEQTDETNTINSESWTGEEETELGGEIDDLLENL